MNPKTGQPWPAISFSRRARSRFDPAGGPGTLSLGASLAGVMLEIFDDHWGPVGSPNRTITQGELDTWWVSLIDLPKTVVFETAGLSLSKMGADLQLLSGDHATARAWALRLSAHPANIGGIAYVSRHDHTRGNLAIFQRPHLLPIATDDALLPVAARAWQREAGHGPGLVAGPAVKLRDHSGLLNAMIELEVGLAP